MIIRLLLLTSSLVVSCQYQKFENNSNNSNFHVDTAQIGNERLFAFFYDGLLGNWIITNHYSLLRTVNRNEEGMVNETFTISANGIQYNNEICKIYDIQKDWLSPVQKPIKVISTAESFTFPYEGLDSNYISQSLLNILDCKYKDEIVFISTIKPIPEYTFKLLILDYNRVALYYGDYIFVAKRKE